MHQKLKDDRGRAANLASSDLSIDEVVNELFLATISRFPTRDERNLLSDQLDGTGDDERRVAIEDILWSLLNHNEFLFQH